MPSFRSSARSGGISGIPQRRLGHRAQLDRLAERQVLGLDLGAHLRVDLLEMQVADAFGARSDDGDVVAAAVADVAGVQAQVDELAVGAVEEAVDVLLGVDMAVGVRVVLRTHAVLLEHRLAADRSCPGSSCATDAGVRLRSSSTAPVAGSRHISG